MFKSKRLKSWVNQHCLKKKKVDRLLISISMFSVTQTAINQLYNSKKKKLSCTNIYHNHSFHQNTRKLQYRKCCIMGQYLSLPCPCCLFYWTLEMTVIYGFTVVTLARICCNHGNVFVRVTKWWIIGLNRSLVLKCFVLSQWPHVGIVSVFSFS